MIKDVKLGDESPPFYFKGSDVELTYLTADYILSKVSEYEIFKRYCTNFSEINKGFCSELRLDKNPDVFIYNNSKGNLYYKDFAKKLTLNCFQYVMLKYNVTFKEALNIIYKDLKPSFTTYSTPVIKVTKLKTYIKPVIRNFNINDYNFWSKYGINLSTLIKFDVYPAEYIYYLKGDKNRVFMSDKKNPFYAYKFIDNGEIYYKIYRPYSTEYKFVFNGNINCIEGFDQLPLHGETLIITKSMKDVMVYYEMGYNAISLQGETNPLLPEIYQKLTKRFNNIIINYDYDPTGIKSSENLTETYNLKCFFIERSKDLSDNVKNYGFQETKSEIDVTIKRIESQYRIERELGKRTF